MPTILSPPDQRVTLRQLSWETYQRLLIEHADASSPRLTFDRGVLEIMSPSAEHERYNLRIGDLIGFLADEMNLEVEGLGATTFMREDLAQIFIGLFMVESGLTGWGLQPYGLSGKVSDRSNVGRRRNHDLPGGGCFHGRARDPSPTFAPAARLRQAGIDIHSFPLSSRQGSWHRALPSHWSGGRPHLCCRRRRAGMPGPPCVA